MIPTSLEYKHAVRDSRRFLTQVTITFPDETTEVWDNSKLMSLRIEEATSDTGIFTIGSAIIGKLSLSVLNQNGEYKETDFIGASLRVKIGLQIPSGVEYINRGIFTVDTASSEPGSIFITALDNLSKLDVPYQTASDLIYPATLDQIYRDACTSCGVYPATAGFLNDDFVVQSRPAEDYTCREILSAVATMAGCFAKADRNGNIVLGWYDELKILMSKTEYDGGEFDSGTPYYTTGVSLSGGSFDDGEPYYTTGDSADGGTTTEVDDFFHIYAASSQEIDANDIEITGIEVSISSESDGSTTTNTYLFGEEGYVIAISENPLIQAYDAAMLQAVADKIVGMKFRRFSMSGRAEPSYETGDSGYISNAKGDSYLTILSSIAFEVNSYEEFTCEAESISEKNSVRYNDTSRNFTKVIQKTESMVQSEKTARELAIEELTNRVNNSSGLYTTIETQSDGSQIFKLHDKPTLEQSQIVWTMTAEAWTVSTNGGASPNAGMTVDGDTIVRILTATGINADWINAGSLTAIDINNGNGTFHVDASGNLTATSGKVGFLQIVGDTMSSDAILFQDSETDPVFILNGNTDTGLKSMVLTSRGVSFNGRNTNSTGWDITLNTNTQAGAYPAYPTLLFTRYEGGIQQEYLRLSKNELSKNAGSDPVDFVMSFGGCSIFFIGGQDVMIVSDASGSVYINGVPF